MTIHASVANYRITPSGQGLGPVAGSWRSFVMDPRLTLRFLRLSIRSDLWLDSLSAELPSHTCHHTSPLPCSGIAALEPGAMASSATAARLHYLNDASHLLALTSPSASAQVRSQLVSLAADQAVTLPDIRQTDSCGACGSTLIPGFSCELSTERSLRLKPSGRTAAQAAQGSSVDASTWKPQARTRLLVCHVCGASTRIRMPDAPRRRTSRQPAAQKHTKGPLDTTKAATSTQSHSSSPATDPQQKGNASSSSKRRAKSRRQSGLQAILAQRRAADIAGRSSTGFGLDLMDLMQKD